MNKIILITFVIINLPILVLFNQITKYINIYDEGDNVRKFQRRKVALFGGIIFTYNLLIFFFIDNFFQLKLFINYYDTREFFSLILGIILFFSIGLYDDKFNLSANKKLFLNSFVILLLILLDERLIIKNLNFSFIEHPIDLRNFSYMFTILCILLLINALNMFDGVNLQTGIYSIIVFIIFILKGIFVQLSLILIFITLFFLYFNLKNKAFLGDSGTQLLAFLISYIFIKSYNYGNSFNPEEIFIILAIPGLDMFRLFILRLINGKNPFHPDTNHIHHMLLNKFEKYYAVFLVQTFIIFNIIFYYYIEMKILSIIITTILYIIFIILVKKKVT